jgi:predicted alpha/beta hydrolase
VTATLLCLVALLAAPAPEVAHRRVIAADGASLALYRYQLAGSGPGRPAVLLLADLGFDRGLLEPLARALALGGRTAYVAELRGQGASDPGFSLRAWVHLDLPAIARAIARDEPGPLDLVAHGWAGTLALAATTRELAVRRVVALNTPVIAEPPVAELEAFLIDGGRYETWGTSPAAAAGFARLYVMGSAIAPGVLAGLLARARDLRPAMAREWLTWLRLGDLPLDDGTTVRGRLARFDRPALLLLALADNVAGPELCAPLRSLTGAAITVRSFSRFDSGDDLSHVTLLAGSNAPRLVFPLITAFLDAPEAP